MCTPGAANLNFASTLINVDCHAVCAESVDAKILKGELMDRRAFWIERRAVEDKAMVCRNRPPSLKKREQGHVLKCNARWNTFNADEPSRAQFQIGDCTLQHFAGVQQHLVTHGYSRHRHRPAGHVSGA